MVLHDAVGAHRRGIVQFAPDIRMVPHDRPGHSGDPDALLRDEVDRLPTVVRETVPQQEVLRRIPADRQLGEHHKMYPGLLRLPYAIDDHFHVATDVADDRVDLCQ